ncbi:response regulator [Haemophilus parahaemolyticus]|uniref:Response regulator n=3 Tax=Haemophilus parahaemolyticus TaxID=735 RepID=A0AAE6JR07_HAEPH|nr:response regulator [Haemophilus parahaemolyticus]EIJ68202.1 response regulator receiver domain protein [Haemophilus parahaemolyticus HK385]OOR96099.1 DNA-binding response regulator [Haemophilus parahaemolyticus]QEN10735.1 response regulator [Haemophilus parahaemolyticus]QRP11925.1 response regulator [Haemophilus parahaemolyticus]STO67318.1 two component transcriptional regulator/response regulator consisting of a CheY-like receiver domain and a winged-helix DNA-binding domain [Haemophilus p
MRILLVEDDKMIAKAVLNGLKTARYAVDWVNNGNTAEQALNSQQYDLVLLDLGLPGQDGLQVLKHLRQEKNNTPVLIVTARDDLDSRLAGLDGGADDYIIKPFDLSELLARIRAVLRRQSGQSTPLLSNGTITLNPTNYQVTLADQLTPIELSNKEFAILQALMTRPGIIHSRADLEDKIYAWGDEVESNAIDFLIHALRKKIGKEHIKNVRGVGWLVSKN